MGRFIFSFLVLGAAICQAAMVEYEKLPEELEESVVYYSTFNDELPWYGWQMNCRSYPESPESLQQ